MINKNSLSPKHDKKIVLLIATNILCFILLISALFFLTAESKHSDDIKGKIGFSQQYISAMPIDTELEIDCDSLRCFIHTDEDEQSQRPGKESYVYLKSHDSDQKPIVFIANDYDIKDKYCDVVGIKDLDLGILSVDSIKCKQIFIND